MTKRKRNSARRAGAAAPAAQPRVDAPAPELDDPRGGRPVALTTAVDNHVDLADALSTEAGETIALLHMVKVFCNLEQRDMTHGALDGTMAAAAEGLAVLMGILADRVESIKDTSRKLYELWPEDSI